jgi:acetone carboxylase gamma subunit
MTVKEILEQVAWRTGGKMVSQFKTQEGFELDVRVLDARLVWNRLDLLITPLSGTGLKWVDAQRVHAASKSFGKVQVQA